VTYNSGQRSALTSAYALDVGEEEMKKALTVLISLAIALSLGASNEKGKVNESPTAGLKDPPWVWHTCEKCESLDGGCYPKNTISSFRTESGKECVHEWKRITENEFNQKWKKKTGEDRTDKGDFEIFGTKTPTSRLSQFLTRSALQS